MLETARLWETLKASYFKDFCDAETDEQLIEIRLKVAMIDDLRGVMRALTNSGEIDNA